MAYGNESCVGGAKIAVCLHRKRMSCAVPPSNPTCTIQIFDEVATTRLAVTGRRVSLSGKPLLHWMSSSLMST